MDNAEANVVDPNSELMDKLSKKAETLMSNYIGTAATSMQNNRLTT